MITTKYLQTAVVIAFAVFGITTTAYGKRIALVIGNSDYKTASALPPLPDSVKDAQQVSEVLRQIGFEIAHGKEYINLTKAQMDEAITDFLNQIKAGDVALFYYSGHGSQNSIDNFLLPIDAENTEDPDGIVGLEDYVITPMGDRDTSANIIILDACRTFGEVKGLAKPKNLPGNMIISYVTEPNKSAQSPSPYTPSLIDNIREPGLRIEDLFSRIRKDVRQKTNNAQSPSVFGSLEPTFYFREQAFIQARINLADDDVKVMINDKTGLTWQTESNNPRNIPLKVGSNELEIKVYNQRTFTGGVEALGGHQPEGWSFNLKFFDKGGKELVTFEGREDRPQKDGVHHGKEFTVIKATIRVDKTTGDVSIENVQKFF